MSEIGDKIQEKCLAFGDRIIKLNDYLLEQASQKYDTVRQKYGMRKGKSSFSHQTSDLSQPSDFSHRTSDVKPQTSRRMYLSPVIPLIIVKTLGYSKNFLYFCTKSLRYE